MKFRNFVFIPVALVCLFVEMAHAGDVFWNNPAGGNWNTASNWNTGTVPQTGDDVHIILNGTYTVTLDVNVNLNSLEIGAASGVQTLTLASRTITVGNSITIHSNGLFRIDDSNTITASINNSGTILVRGFNSTMSGSLTNQSGALVEFDPVVNHSSLTLSSGSAVNHGTWRMKNEITAGRVVRLHTNSGVSLTNASGGTLISAGSLGSREILGSLINQGTVTVDHDLSWGTSGASSSNSGNVSIASGKTLTISGGFAFNGGTLTGPGEAFFNSSQATFNVANFPAANLRFESSTLAASGVIASAGNLTIDNSNTITASINNSGTIRVRGFNSTMSGFLTTQAASLMEFDPVVNHSVLTMANGFTNHGTLRMKNEITAGRVVRLNFNSGQTLTNASGGEIISAGTMGGSREINGSLNNAGLLTINHPLQVTGASVVNAAGGVVSGTTTLTVLGTSFENAGTVNPGAAGKGILTLSGSLNQPSNGALNVGLEGLTPGTQYDRLAVSNTADLNGTLNISLLNGYEPAIGDSFLVLTYGSRVDTFSTVTGQDIGNGKYLYTKYRPNHLALRVGPPPVTPSYTISASAGPNGGISPSGEVQVFQGLDQTFTITPAFGYQVDEVLVDGASVGAVTSYTFTNVAANHTIHATFAVQTFTITATAGPNGAIQPSGNVIVNGGEDQAFNIVPNAGYHVLDVLVDNVSIGAATSYVFNSVTANHTIHATFEINTYIIQASAGAGGSINPSGNVPVTHGNSQLFTITPNANFQVAEVFVDGNPVGAVTEYEFTSVSAGHAIQAFFAPITYTIAASAGSGGAIQPSGNVIVQQSGDFTFNILAYPDYSIGHVLVDGASVGAVSQYTFSNVTANHTIAASFIQNNYTITIISGPNGATQPSGAVNVGGGTSLTVNVFPNSGYHVAEVLVDGSSVGPATSYTFNNIAANHTLSASFALNVYTIFASAGPGGSITPSGAVTVNHGGDQGFTITPGLDYNVGDVMVDGVSQGAISSYDFLNVTANHSIGAYFTPENFSYVTLNTGVTVNIHATYFVSATVGYAVGEGGIILITGDGGQTWTQSQINAEALHGVVVVNDTIWVAGTNGHLCYSVNGGLSWVPAGPGGDAGVLFHHLQRRGGLRRRQQRADLLLERDFLGAAPQRAGGDLLRHLCDRERGVCGRLRGSDLLLERPCLVADQSEYYH